MRENLRVAVMVVGTIAIFVCGGAALFWGVPLGGLLGWSESERRLLAKCGDVCIVDFHGDLVAHHWPWRGPSGDDAGCDSANGEATIPCDRF